MRAACKHAREREDFIESSALSANTLCFSLSRCSLFCFTSRSSRESTPDAGQPCTDDNLSCGSQCTNCGKYCYVDPNKDLDTPPDGSDVVKEAAYEKCLWTWGDSNSQPMLWWKYVLARQQLNCGVDPDPIGCQSKAADASGVPSEARNFIQSCMGDLTYLQIATNPIMEQELNWAAEWQPLRSPYMSVSLASLLLLLLLLNSGIVR